LNSTLRRCWTFGVALLLAGGCKQILSMEEAELDPTLTAGSGGTAGTQSTGGDGGLGGTSGNNGDGQAGGGTGATEGDAGPDVVGPSLCDRYCSTVMPACTGEHRVYSSTASCQAACGALPPGEPGSENTNTVHCRLRQAEFARNTGEDYTYCPSAGPAGSGKCGSNCESLCAMIEGVCKGANRKYEDEQVCQRACAKLPDLGTFNTIIADESPQHVQCRIYHVTNAAIDPDEHCDHAAGIYACENPEAGL
jgi:hypothetical protein